MKVHGVFLADEGYELSGGGMNLNKAGIVQRVVSMAMESFLTNVVVVGEITSEDIGRSLSFRAELLGPDGVIVNAHSTRIRIEEPATLLRTPMTVYISPARVGTHTLRVTLGGNASVSTRFSIQYENPIQQKGIIDSEFLRVGL